MSDKENYVKSKDKAVSYALDKMETSAASFKSSKKEKKSGDDGAQSGGNVLVRAARSVFPHSGDSKGEVARKLFLLVAVIVFAVALSYLIWELTSIEDDNVKDKEIADLAGSPLNDFEADIDYTPPRQVENPVMTEVTGPGTEEPEYLDLTPVVNKPLNINWENLWAVNPDVRAWIKLTGTLINYPVLAGDSEDFYLTHDVERNESISGSIFSSARNKWDGTDDNIILFGHNMVKGTYFSYLVHYVPNDWSREPLAFYKVHPVIQMATPDGGSQIYKVFAGMYVNTQEERGEVFQYVGKTKFYSQDDFNNFILDVMDRSWFFTDVDITYGDEILTMSTCSWPLGRTACDTRWVVFARRVREGESEEVDTTVAKRNYNAKLFEYWYKVRGGSWKGRTWDTSKLLSYSD